MSTSRSISRRAVVTSDLDGRIGPSVALYWIPLGAGAHSVRLNGIVYEAVTAAIERRARCDLYHSVLELAVPSGRYMVEMTPVPDRRGERARRRRGGPSRSAGCGAPSALPLRGAPLA